MPRAHLEGDRESARARFGLPSDGPVLAFFGGLAGAQALNEFAAETYGTSGPAVLHIAGERDYETVRSKVVRPDYVLLETTNDFGDALRVADLAISRAGGTVWELAAAGTPSILVPYPHATADHQALNARYFEQGGGAVVVRQDDLDAHSRARRRASRGYRPSASDGRSDEGAGKT